LKRLGALVMFVWCWQKCTNNNSMVSPIRKVKSMLRIACSVSLSEPSDLPLHGARKALQCLVEFFSSWFTSRFGLRVPLSHLGPVKARLRRRPRDHSSVDLARLSSAKYYTTAHIIHHCLPSQISPRQKRHITTLTPLHYRFQARWPRRSLGILLARQHHRSTAAPNQACDRHLRKRHTYKHLLSSLPCS
jgi:hypothetical protein